VTGFGACQNLMLINAQIEFRITSARAITSSLVVAKV
jgi:hypothetical protein